MKSSSSLGEMVLSSFGERSARSLLTANVFAIHLSPFLSSKEEKARGEPKHIQSFMWQSLMTIDDHFSGTWHLLSCW